MMGSLYSGMSGLKSHQTKMNVIANNIANVNTIGFKPGRVNFQEALVQTTKGAGRPSSVTGGTNPIQMGLGIQVATIDNLFLQGGLETTGQITDLAIQGQGFFVLGDNYGNRFYTRAGAFGFDANSSLVDPATGLFVQGKMADGSGQIPSLATTGAITLPFGQQDPARATDFITMANNLDASATDAVATLSNAGTANIFTVSGTAANGVGGAHRISITGTQSINSTFTSNYIITDGAGGTMAGTLGLNDTMTSLGVDDFATQPFGISIDGASAQLITGLSGASTVSDLLSAISRLDGITAQLVGGQIEIARDKAGDPVTFNFTSTDSMQTLHADGYPTNGNIVGVLFGVADAGTFASAGGAATTMVATDVFTPRIGTGLGAVDVTTTLDLVIDENTGLVIGLDGVGNGGIEVEANPAQGLTATTPGNELMIKTADTVHSTSINVFDSQGSKHVITVEFFKSAIPNRWEWSAMTLANEEITVGMEGFVSFNSDGSLNTFDYAQNAEALVINPNNGADVMRLQFDVGTPGNYDGLTSFASGAHTASMIGQDGYGLGMLEKISIDKSGNISGIFTNGVTRLLAQIVLADFNNQAGLMKAGRSLYQASPNSGEAVEAIASETISAQITSGALESSAVDIAQEFTGMITAQRGFQANARIITTSDQMLEQLVNLKR